MAKNFASTPIKPSYLSGLGPDNPKKSSKTLLISNNLAYLQ